MSNRGAASPRASVSPGALTALLVELIRVPASTTGWVSPPVHGDVVGRFEIQREIGRGGFGVVYEALDRELGRAVAFKAVRAVARASAPDDLVLAEAESAARLAHPNIAHLYDLGRCEMGPYLILECFAARPSPRASRVGRSRRERLCASRWR